MSRVVVAEDDPHILRVIAMWLTREGHEVIETRNGLAALEAVRAQRPDVLVTDVNMHGMDGLELVDRLAQENLSPRGIVVLTNRHDHYEIRERLSKARVHVYPKPFSPNKLSELIHQLVADGDDAGQPQRGAIL